MSGEPGPFVAPPGSLLGRDLLSAAGLTPGEASLVFETAAGSKSEFIAGRRQRRLPLVRRTLAMLVERPRLRTRVTLEAGMIELGGAAIQEITSGVMDGPGSLVFQQTEHRLHVQKGLLVEVLGEEDPGAGALAAPSRPARGMGPEAIPG